MTIHHVNSNCSYELYEVNGDFFIESGTHQSTHPKRDLHEAIWYLIDWIRIVSFTNLSEEDCERLKDVSKSMKKPDKEAVMNTICGRKLDHLFYEHTHALIYEAYNHDSTQIISLHNDINFFISREILQLMKLNPAKISQ